MPSLELVKKALRAIERPIDFEFFFNELKSPDWLEPLAAARVFDKPYPPLEEKDWISFPIWPPSRYLARMAAQAPQAVAKLALAIPETKNVRIHEDFIDAALAMPADTAQSIVPKAKVWAKSIYELRLSDKLGRLISHLALGGQAEKALELAWSLLELHQEKKHIAGIDEDEKYQLPPKPRSVVSDYSYERILKKHIPDLVRTAGLQALELLCDLLEQAVTFSRRTEDDIGPEDYSYIWRRAIESHSQNEGHDLSGSLVSAVRDASESIADSNPEFVLSVIQCLQLDSRKNAPRKWKVFKRIVFHLMRDHPGTVMDLVSRYLTSRTNLDDPGVHHEYSLLLKNIFGKLQPLAQGTILGWIEAGPPDTDRWIEFQKERTGVTPSSGDMDRYKRSWQLKKLAMFPQSLPTIWVARYNALIEEFGPPEYPEFSAYSAGVMRGPRSPKDSTDLAQMRKDELRQFLMSWQPSKEVLGIGPSQEGLGREISQMVAKDPEKYSHFSPAFQYQDPTYVRSFLQGFRDVIGQHKTFTWAPVIDLSYWVITQPREIPGRVVDEWAADQDWSWARKSVASLLSSGFEEGACSIPWCLREKAWEILSPITNDPNPEPSDEAEKKGVSPDPSHISVNSVRGEAMQAVIHYACWVKLNLKRKGEKKLLGQGFGSMPEVRSVLEAHLEPTMEPSLAIRSVYGRWFPTVHWLDAKWTIRNTRKIFPAEPDLRKFNDAAWETYVIFSTPYLNMLEVLKEQYSKSVAEMGRPSTIEHSVGSPHERLAEHLMIFYWHGKLSYRGSRGILGKFYLTASDELLGHAHDFLGRNLHSAKGKMSPAVLDRLRKLWEWRAEKARSAPASSVKALAAFGWWFASGKFPHKWSMDQLAVVLQVAKKVDVDYLVLERLLVVSRDMPLQAIRCIHLMCEGAEKHWEISSWLEEIKKIISAVIRNNRGVARNEAIELAEHLTAKGYRYFDDLLDNS